MLAKDRILTKLKRCSAPAQRVSSRRIVHSTRPPTGASIPRTLAARLPKFTYSKRLERVPSCTRGQHLVLLAVCCDALVARARLSTEFGRLHSRGRDQPSTTSATRHGWIQLVGSVWPTASARRRRRSFPSARIRIERMAGTARRRSEASLISMARVALSA